MRNKKEIFHYKHKPIIRNGRYALLKNKLIRAYGEQRAGELIKLAKEFHNPMNFDKGEPIKKKHGWNRLFTDLLKEKRYYFPFHDLPNNDEDTILAHFLACWNFSKYSEIWKCYAPQEISSKLIYVLAITEMTARGLQHEDRVASDLKSKGHSVEKSSATEDYEEGIDLWGDGKPVQVKSPATEYMMNK